MEKDYNIRIANKLAGWLSVLLAFIILFSSFSSGIITENNLYFYSGLILFIVYLTAVFFVKNKEIVHLIRFSSFWLILIMASLKIVFDLNYWISVFSNNLLGPTFHLLRYLITFGFYLSIVNEFYMIFRKTIPGKRNINKAEWLVFFVSLVFSLLYIENPRTTLLLSSLSTLTTVIVYHIYLSKRSV